MAVDVPSGRRLQFNLAAQGHRSAGSAFKPFVLAAAMEQGISPYATFSGPPELVIDDRRCYTNNQPWDVHNYADEQAGTMTLLDATAHSVNTIFAQLVTQVGPDQVVSLAHAVGISSPLLPVCSITLGSQPVSPLEMADGYATFAARGIHHPPQALQLVKLPNGQTEHPSAGAVTRALPQNDADLVTYALQGVVQFGTGTAAALGRPVAGKTGTAENFQDAWFCGYVPQLTTCVWVGYPQAEIPLQNIEGLAGVFGGSLPAEIWHDFMSGAVATLPVLDFATPDFSTNNVFPAGSNVPSTQSTTSSTQTQTTPTPPAPPPPPQPSVVTVPPAPPPPPTSLPPPPATTQPPAPPPPPPSTTEPTAPTGTQPPPPPTTTTG
jgi:penicillin-binding protein 1A